MDEPKKLVVLKALTAWLQGIKHVNGDPENDWGGFNLEEAVFRGRTIYGDDDPLPMLSLLESPRPDFPRYAGTNEEAQSEDWAIFLQGWVKDDKANPTDPAYYLLEAVEKRLNQLRATHSNTSGGIPGSPVNKANYMLGGLLTGINFGPAIVRPPDGVISAKAFFYLPLKLGLASVVG